MKISFASIIGCLTLGAILSLSSCGGSKDKDASADTDSAVTEKVADQADAKTDYSDIMVNEIPTQGPAVIDFWAEWCGPCRQMKPLFHSLASKYGKQLAFAAVNVDEAGELASEYGIHNIPTFIFLNAEGKECGRIVGTATEEEMASAMAKAVGAPLQ